MAKLTVTTITSGFAAPAALNSNFAAIAEAFENTLSRDGTSPNAMEANLDMDSHRILNLPAPSNNTEPVRLVDLADSDATGAASAQLRSDLGDATTLSNGDDLIAFKQSDEDGELDDATARTVHEKLQERVSLFDFMTETEMHDWQAAAYSVDVTTAVQNAINYAKTKLVVVEVPPGGGKITDELDCYLASGGGSWGLQAAGKNVAVFKCYFNGFDKAVFKTRGADRSAAPTFRNLRVEFDSSVTQCPVGFDMFRPGNYRMYGCSVAASNNTQFRSTAAFNCDGDDLVCFNGGRFFPYKDTDGNTFSITSGSTTLTSANNVFSAADATYGAAIHLRDSNNNETFIISGFTDAKTVTVSRVANRTFAAATGTFENARGSITSADTTFTTNADVFAATDVGQTIYIQGAGVSGGILKAEIVTFNAANSVELDTAASTTVTNEYFTVPAVAFDQDTASGDSTNDLTFSNVHVEDFQGTGVVLDGQSRFFMEQYKVHAPSSPSDENVGSHNFWISASDPLMTGTVEGQDVNSQAKIVCIGLTRVVSLPFLGVVTSHNHPLVLERNSATGGRVSIGEVSVINSISNATRDILFQNASTSAPRIDVKSVSILSTAAMAFPMNAPSGTYKGWYEEDTNYGANVAFTFATPGDLAATYTTRNVSFMRIGRRVTVRGHLVLNPFTHTTASGSAQITGMPYAAAGDAPGVLTLNGCTSLSGSLSLNLSSGSTTLTLQHNQTGTLAALAVANFATGSTKTIRFEITYMI